jgi:hypothetical protein
LDDITPLREIPIVSSSKKGNLLFSPRSTYRLKLQWAVGVFDGDGKDYSPAFGLPGATYRQKEPDGTKVRRHLDVGENPPGGAIFYYWLGEKPESVLGLSVYENTGNVIQSFLSDETEKLERRLPAEQGLNRFVWNLNYPSAQSFDPTLIKRDYKPFAQESEGSGPSAVPGQYTVQLSLAGRTIACKLFMLLKDPRVDATQADFDEQFELLRQLTTKRSELRAHVDRIRIMRHQLDELVKKLPKGRKNIVSSVGIIQERLSLIENALVDVHRESPRDVLRHPAGLDDTLGELMSAISMADVAPPIQTRKVSEEVVAKVEAEFKKLKKLIEGPIGTLNRKAEKAGVPAVSA